MAADTTRQRLQLALRQALKARDPVATSALRSALAAIDNASAVPAGPPPGAGAGSVHVAGAVSGLGASEAERRVLDAAEAEQIVRAEIAERRAAAQDYEARGHPDRAARLRREASILLSAIETAEVG
ncbi:MAG: hypothetical protein ACRDOB_19980 [Streptosporangiaceae bacterium]